MLGLRPPRSLCGASFRAHPGWDLVAFSDLSPTEREILGPIAADSEMFGVLVSRSGGGAMKAVGHETARVVQALRAPGSLVEGGAADGEALDRAAARLVLDDVLQVADPTSGEFVSGFAAREVVFGPGSGAEAAEPPHSLARLSLAALRHSASLRITDVLQLSARLYRYHGLPRSPAWVRRFPSTEELRRFLGFEVGRLRAVTERDFEDLPPRGDGWRVWRARRDPRKAGTDTCKLYVSPRPEVLPGALPAIVEALARSGALGFKVGDDLPSLLRPEKLVAYFAARAELDEAAEAILSIVAGMPAQGVPFSAPIDPAGLLSWGCDPPRAERPLPWLGPSWRRWVCDRLAAALAAAVGHGEDEDVVRFALDRLSLEGVDPMTFAPAGQGWS